MACRSMVALIALISPVAAAAQDEAAVDLTKMKTLESAVPKQGWYPDGYYDLRIAAEAEVAAMPPPTLPAPGESYNLTACNAPRADIDTHDPQERVYADIAFETARLRASLDRLGYPATLYSAPLIAFERERLSDVLPKDEIYGALAMALDGKAPPGVPAMVAFDDCPPPPPPPPPPPAAAGPPSKPAKPVKPSASLPKPVAPSSRGVTFVTEPVAGEVLMISAFAFKVCVRRQPDPWDRFACRWNEVETGVAKPMSGRFVYQVKWPDGTVRRGTREISTPPEESTSVTFRKTGS